MPQPRSAAIDGRGIVGAAHPFVSSCMLVGECKGQRALFRASPGCCPTPARPVASAKRRIFRKGLRQSCQRLGLQPTASDTAPPRPAHARAPGPLLHRACGISDPSAATPGQPPIVCCQCAMRLLLRTVSRRHSALHVALRTSRVSPRSACFTSRPASCTLCAAPASGEPYRSKYADSAARKLRKRSSESAPCNSTARSDAPDARNPAHTCASHARRADDAGSYRDDPARNTDRIHRSHPALPLATAPPS